MPRAAKAGIDQHNQYVILANSIKDRGEMVYDCSLFAKPDYLRKPPVLPYAMSLFKNPHNYMLVQAILSALLVVPIFFLGFRWFNSAAGLVAAGLWAFWGPAIVLVGYLNQETLHSLFFLLALLALDISDEKGKWPFFLLVGLFLAMAELTRPVLAPFFVCLLLFRLFWLAVSQKKMAQLFLVLALLLGYLIPILPYQYAKREHGFSYVYDRKAVIMLMATLEQPLVYQYIDEHKPDEWDEMSDGEREQFIFGLFWQRVKENPKNFVTQIIDHEHDFWFAHNGSWPTVYPQPWEWLTFLAIFGLIFLWFQKKQAFIYSLFLTFDFSLMAGVVHKKPRYFPRFFEVAAPWFLILAAIGMIGLIVAASRLAGRIKMRGRTVKQ